MSLIHEVIEDLDAAIDRLTSTFEPRQQRRALREALGHLYSLRAWRETEQVPTGLPQEQAIKQAKSLYRSAAKGVADGRAAEGIALIRGSLVHDLVMAADLQPHSRGGYGAHYGVTYGASAHLVWRRQQEMPVPLSSTYPTDRRLGDYDSEVGGREVIDTLLRARDFLVKSPVLPSLPPPPVP